MLILAFESSCDETSAAVVGYDGGFKVYSNIVASQISIHAKFGGVVPEIASRAHCEAISGITYEALAQAGKTMDDIDAIAVTSYPGLIGALLVGVNFAKSLAYAYNKKLIAVDHIKGHICACCLKAPMPEPPFIALVVSGGHTSIVLVTEKNGERVYDTVGGTRDDAMGEAFDKIGRVLGVPYPGGAELDRLARLGKGSAVFPSAAMKGDNLDLSFSGLKTAVLNYINTKRNLGKEPDIPDIAASFVRTAVSSVTEKLDAAIMKYPEIKQIVLAGGVSANSHLREETEKLAKKRRLTLFMPELKYCGDNAAMIGAAGYYEAKRGNYAGISLNASPFDDAR